MYRYLLNIAFFVFISASLYSQGIINEQPKMLFSNESTFGVFMNTNGLGADYRFAKYIDVRNDKIYDFSFNYLKDLKETKSYVYYESLYGRTFVYGKKNHFWEIKATYGRQKELYRKYDYSSVSIRAYYAGGIALGFQKPIYYVLVNLDSITGTLTEPRKIESFNDIDPINIGGTAPFLTGLNETLINPGITAKGGFNFEFSDREPVIHALETGLEFTAYLRNVEILDTQVVDGVKAQQHFFFKFYVGYRFGKMLDISEAAMAKSRKERRKERKEAIGDTPIIRL